MVDSISTGSDTAIQLQTVSDDKTKEDEYEPGNENTAVSPRPGSTNALPQLENGRSEPESELDKKVERKWMAAIYGLMFLAGEFASHTLLPFFIDARRKANDQDQGYDPRA
jgi:hypothetical protein